MHSASDLGDLMDSHPKEYGSTMGVHKGIERLEVEDRTPSLVTWKIGE